MSKEDLHEFAGRHFGRQGKGFATIKKTVDKHNKKVSNSVKPLGSGKK